MKQTKITCCLAFISICFWYSCKKNEYKNLDCSAINSSYSAVIKPIITNNCVSSGCHKSGSIYGDFTTYQGLQAAANSGDLNNRVLIKKDMPESSTLSLDDRKKIKCWIDNGALNN